MANDDQDETIAIAHGDNFDNLFPGYYPPSEDERLGAYQRGLVSIDANALLDLYRFSEQARNEFFDVLEKLRSRLFVTHQAALEFNQNRLNVVESRLNAVDEKCQEIDRLLNTVIQRIQEFVNRHQIDASERQRLIGLVESLSSALAESIKAAGTYDLTEEQVRDGTDPVLTRVKLLLDGRVGQPFDEERTRREIEEAERRARDRIPPGYRDDKKASPEQRAGDYFVWRQLMDEVSVHGRPILLISNESKEDWVFKGNSGQVLGPRPELVLEMRQEAGVSLIKVTVVGLLKEAPGYLGTSVSQATIKEAESLPSKQRVGIRFEDNSEEEFRSLPPGGSDRFLVAVRQLQDILESGQSILGRAGVRAVSETDPSTFELRISNVERAWFYLDYDPSGPFDLTVVFTKIYFKGAAASR